MYKLLAKEKVVYVDCDDTLLLWEPERYTHKPEDVLQLHDEDGVFAVIPHARNIKFIKQLKVQGYGIVIWSAAGSIWAETVIRLLGLQDLPDMIISKPELCIDDLLEPKRIVKSIVWIDPDSGEFKRNA